MTTSVPKYLSQFTFVYLYRWKATQVRPTESRKKCGREYLLAKKEMEQIFCDNLHINGQITRGKGIYRCAAYSLGKTVNYNLTWIWGKHLGTKEYTYKKYTKCAPKEELVPNGVRELCVAEPPYHISNDIFFNGSLNRMTTTLGIS